MENVKIDGKHGNVKQDDNSKYFEFIFDGSLSKLQDVVFYNKYVQAEAKTESEPESDPVEDNTVVDEKKETEEIIKQVQTGDALTKVIAVLILTSIVLGATYIKKRK